MNTDRAADRRVARRIAVMMRIGTTGATILLLFGAAFLTVDDTTATVLLTAGCALMIALPVVRLAMMAAVFARLHEHRYLAVTLAVLALIVLGGAVGLGR